MNVTKTGTKHSQPNHSEWGLPQKDSAEHESYAGACDSVRITENTATNANEPRLLEQILNRNNLNQAYERVKRNKGVHGVDKMGVGEMLKYLKTNGDAIKQAIAEGKYKPNPVRRVEIPKDEGKSKRPLGIPTVIDRLIQQAIAQVLSPIFEKQFHDNSYGFRPKRSCHDAIKQSQEYITQGYKYVVDMDLEKFFDTVNQSKLIEVLSRTIKDGRVISLINKYLRAGVMIKHSYKDTFEGVPQGGPLSPLLSNIMLNELDKELEKRGHRFVRYADDLMIFCKSRRAAERTLTNILPFIENKLFLKVNKDKTVVDYVGRVKFLGVSFYEKEGQARVRIHPKSVLRLKAKIRQLTARSNGWSNEKRKQKLREYIIGWINYFKIADIKSLLVRLDEWLRRRLRMVIWKLWKKTYTKYTNLVKLGIDKAKAWEWANTRKGYWRASKSPILHRSLTTENLRKAGYLFFSDYHKTAVKKLVA
jgi:group II intron reverse transcriptase/maturase